MTIYHRHHVVPRHAGGTDDPLNIIVCTIEEHAEHHRYRYEMTGDEYDRIAWQSLLGMITKQETIRQVQIENGRRNGRAQLGRRKQSEETRRKIAEANRGRKHGKHGKPNPMLGKTHSEETRRKLADANRGRKFSDEHRRKIGDAARGKKHSEEARRKMVDAHARRKMVAEVGLEPTLASS